MNRNELLQIIADSKIFQHWHWFRWHFKHPLYGHPNVLADSIIEACLTCEARIPGYAERTISLVASLGGREKHRPDWEQLLQVLAELLVVSHILRLDWDASTTFEAEPSVSRQGKNPEILVRDPHITLAVEVKAPALFSYQENRSKNPEQIAARFASHGQLHELLRDPNKATLPRDNPVKDFLISAQNKFEQFKGENNFVSALVIVWDDYIYEPLSALLHPNSGLLTEHSFYRDENGTPIKFESVGAVVLIRQLHQFMLACQNEALVDDVSGPLQYDIADGFPPKAILRNRVSDEQFGRLCQIFLASPPDPNMGAEYTPKELIWWL